MTPLDALDIAMKWLVAPIGAFAIWLYNRLTALETAIKVLERDVENNKNIHDKDMAETRDYLKGIMQKLDNIEVFLRK